MSHKIIFPEGIELIEYLNRGYAICNECGALMERREDPRGGCDIYTSARPVDGKLMKWNTSTNATRMSTKEVTTFRLPDAVRAVDRIRIANCHASYLTTNKAEEKS